MISAVNISKFFLLMISGLLLAGCLSKNNPPQDIHEFKGEVFGAYYVIKYRGELDRKKFTEDLNQFFADFNYEFSTYQENSVISSLNRLPVNKKIKVSKRFIKMLNLAKKFHEETQGAFDPTLGPVIRAWGFGGGKEKRVPSDSELASMMEKVGFSFIQWSEEEVWKTRDVSLDVNAFAPGWAADLIGKLLEDRGVQNYMVDISGEILFKGDKGNNEAWVAGIETPSKEYVQGVQIALKIKDLAIATSGNYRQFFDDKGNMRAHILDPKSGRPILNQISSASVITSSAAQADAWSTALMVLGEEGIDLAEKHGIKVYLLKAKKPQIYKEIISPGMKSYIEANRL